MSAKPEAPTLTTSPQQLLDLEYQRFVEFGQVLDRTGRRYLVEYIRHRLEPDRPLPHDMDDAYFRYFREALQGVLSLDALVELCRVNAGLRRQVATDTLRWLRLTYQELRSKHPYEDEVSRLESWAITPEHLFAERWPLLTTFLENTYTEHELPVGFFKGRFAEGEGSSIARGARKTRGAIQERNAAAPRGSLAPLAIQAPVPQAPDLGLLLRDLLAQWDALLHAKILAHQLDNLKEKAEDFQQLMEAKVQEYTKLIKIVSPFSDYLAGYWDMSRGLWQDTSFDVLEHYADLLAREDELRELADLLGQWREAEIELEEETLEKTIVRQQWVSDPSSALRDLGRTRVGRLE